VRALGLSLFIAIALFGVAFVNSPRQDVVDGYRAILRDRAAVYPQWRPMVNARIVDVDLYNRGRSASASLRTGGCTLWKVDASLERGADGRWEQVWWSTGVENRSGPACKERGVNPPAELEWMEAWQ
jgi:hypothetical protein